MLKITGLETKSFSNIREVEYFKVRNIRWKNT